MTVQTYSFKIIIYMSLSRSSMKGLQCFKIQNHSQCYKSLSHHDLISFLLFGSFVELNALFFLLLYVNCHIGRHGFLLLMVGLSSRVLYHVSSVVSYSMSYNFLMECKKKYSQCLLLSILLCAKSLGAINLTLVSLTTFGH